MSITDLFGVGSKSQRSETEYPEAEPKDNEEADVDQDVYTYVQKVTVKQKRDFNTVKSEFRDGRIVLIEIDSQYPHGTDNVAKHMSQFVQQFNGDIVALRDNLLLMTPEDIGISRESK